jgi:DNA-binding MarR family transcriptional regulator
MPSAGSSAAAVMLDSPPSSANVVMSIKPRDMEGQVLTSEVVRRLLYRRDVAVARHRAAFARSLGLTDVEVLALIHLREQGPLAPSQIAALLDLSSGGATSLVQRLELAGLVGRQPHPTDRRSTLIRLSERAAATLDDAQSPLMDGLEQAISPLAETERLAVLRFFTDLAILSEELATTQRVDAETTIDTVRRPVPSLWA